MWIRVVRGLVESARLKVCGGPADRWSASVAARTSTASTVRLFLLHAFPVALTLVPIAGVGAPGLAWQTTGAGRTVRLEVPAGGKTGFTLLAPNQTGIRFTNFLDDRLIMENNNFMEGSGLALGDFDGDGWCDVYFCAIDGTNALYRNLGGWRFEDVTVQAGVSGAGWHSTGAVFADVDGDDDLDLIVSTLGRGTHCFANLGGGRFREVTAEAGLTSRTGSLGLALGDVDGDGDLDLYVANYGTVAILRAGGRAELKQVNGKWEVAGPYAERLRVVDGRLEEVGEPDVLYLNDGRGRFQPVPWNSEWFRDDQGNPMQAPWDFGLGVQIRDINEDGFPDIYVCNDFQTVDRVWMNDGRGRFRLLSKIAMRQQSYASMGVDFADIDRDGHLDFFVVEMMSREHARRMRHVLGFQPAFSYPGYFENRPETARNTLFHNRGDGTYAEIAHFSGVEASEWSWQPVFLDVDLDGFEDILVANGNSFDVQDRDVLARVRALGRQTPEQTRTNILLYPRLDTPNVAFRNRGDLTFEEVGGAWGFDSRKISHGIGLADLDRDGDLDVAVNALYAGPLIYRNDTPAPRVAVRLRGKSPNVQGIGARVRLLGGAVPVQSQEIVSGGRYLAGDEPARVFAAGPSSKMSLEVTWRDGRTSLVSNVQPNSIYEIAEDAVTSPSPRPPVPATVSPLFTDASPVLRHSHHEELFDDYLRQPLLMKQLSQLGPGVGWFDLDGDQHEDLIVGAGKGAPLAVFAGDGRGGLRRLSGGLTQPVADDLAGLACWVTASGERRLLTAQASYENPATNGLRVLAWAVDSRTGSLTNWLMASLPGDDSSPGPMAVADYDGDGELDLFVGGRIRGGNYPAPASSALFRQEKGRLLQDQTQQPSFSGTGLVSGAVWTDLDSDGFPELVLACEWGPIRVFQNQRGRLVERTRERGLAGFIGWWNSITAADLDGDGRMDLIAGNWGLNSPYRASKDEPLRLYYGDIGGRGVTDLFEAYVAPGLGLVPRRTLASLAQAAPALQEHFPTHRAFGTATMGEVFEKLQVRPAELQANILESTVFFNRGDRFEAVPLPSECQWSIAFGITGADFDGDGQQDVFVAQNFFGNRPELSRLDAGRGLMMRGVGAGRLEVMTGTASGLAIYGEQRGAAAGDFDEDGRVDLVVSQNGAPTRLFRNTGGRPGLRVRLVGPPGNPDGIGCMVRLRFGSNWGPALERRAGSGYWSQDGAVVCATPQPPTAIQVRWPGGHSSEIGVSQDARAVSVFSSAIPSEHPVE